MAHPSRRPCGTCSTLPTHASARVRRCWSATSTCRRSTNFLSNSTACAPVSGAHQVASAMRPDAFDSLEALGAYVRDPDVVSPPDGIEARRLKIYADLVFNNV